MGATFNAANEVAVQEFVDNKIKFTDIAKAVEHVMNEHDFINDSTLQDIMDADENARKETKICLS